MLTKQEFVHQLRDALNHLYNPEQLRKSRLGALFGLAKRFDTGSALQRILIDAINSLEPPPDGPHHSQAWQVYEPLFYRYVEQLSPEQVADQMAISVRHLRRKQQIALEVLADALWSRHNLENLIAENVSSTHPDKPGKPPDSLVDQELAWLKDTASNSSTDLSEVSVAILNLAQKLADRHDVHLDVTLAEPYPKLAMNPVALRQIMLNLLHVAIPRASGGRVRLSASVSSVRHEVEIRIYCREYLSGPKLDLDSGQDNVNMARSLADLSGCSLNVEVDSRSFDATLTVPAFEQWNVLVIDDNVDSLQMLSRYASGTRYHLIASPDPEQAVPLAELNHPKVIVLDVMMPGVDGWEVLQRLRQNPTTADIPIIVCTILAQEELALSLGVDDFLRKPVSQQSFLNALNQFTV